MSKYFTLVILIILMGITKMAWGKTEKNDLPRVMLMVTEKSVGGYSVDEAELIMSGYLIAHGFSVVDQELMKVKIKRDQMLSAMNGDQQAAVAMGLKFDADIVIVCRAIAKGSAEHIQKSNMRSFQGTVTAKAINVDTAEIIATEQASASAPHTDDTTGGSVVLKSATEEMIKGLCRKIVQKLDLKELSEPKVQILISGVRQLWQLAALKRVFTEKITGVESVTQRDFVLGVATFDVTSTINADDISKEMILMNEDAFKLTVTSISPGKINAKFIEK